MMRHRTWLLGMVVAMGLLPATAPLFVSLASPLDDFRAQGVIGERFDGFAEARPGAPRAARDLVAEINGRRQKVYVKRAKEQGVAADQVGRVYANEIMGKLPAGSWIKLESGEWRQK